MFRKKLVTVVVLACVLGTGALQAQGFVTSNFDGGGDAFTLVGNVDPLGPNAENIPVTLVGGTHTIGVDAAFYGDTNPQEGIRSNTSLDATAVDSFTVVWDVASINYEPFANGFFVGVSGPGVWLWNGADKPVPPTGAFGLDIEENGNVSGRLLRFPAGSVGRGQSVLARGYHRRQPGAGFGFRLGRRSSGTVHRC